MANLIMACLFVYGIYTIGETFGPWWAFAACVIGLML